MKLLYVLPEYLPQEGGGIITFYRHLLPELVRQGHEVRALVGSGVTQGDFDGTIDGVATRFLPESLFREWLPRFGAFRMFPELQRHLAAAHALQELARNGEGFDVVETTDWGLLFLPWAVAGGGPPVVAQLHGSIGQIDLHDPVRGQEMYGRLVRMLEGAGLAALPGLQTYSEANARAWRDATGSSVEVIRPALPLSPASGARGNRGLVVGRVQKWKGVETLCAACRRLGTDAPAIDWVGRDTVDAGGGGSYASAVAGRFPDVWGRAVRHLGQRGFAESERMRREAAFVVVPSLWDMFNFTVVESMAAGCVVVASTGAAASELIEHGRNGFTFAPTDDNALAELLKRVAGIPPAERDALGRAARETVSRDLDPATRASDRVSRYRSLPPRTARGGWLRDAIAPGADDPFAFLEHLPLREIAAHSLKRISRKVGKGR